VRAGRAVKIVGARVPHDPGAAARGPTARPPRDASARRRVVGPQAGPHGRRSWGTSRSRAAGSSAASSPPSSGPTGARRWRGPTCGRCCGGSPTSHGRWAWSGSGRGCGGRCAPITRRSSTRAARSAGGTRGCLRGELLAGVSLPAAPEFEAWLEMERATCEARCARQGCGRPRTRRGRVTTRRPPTCSAASTARTPSTRPCCGPLVAAPPRLRHRGARDPGGVRAPLSRGARRRTRAGDAGARGRDPGRARRAHAPCGPRGARPRGGCGVPRGVATLPVPLTPFVGRAISSRGVGEDRRPACRVLTLVGPGGVGKTRIAIEVARGSAIASRRAPASSNWRPSRARAPSWPPSPLRPASS
jgi:hypothetical protein